MMHDADCDFCENAATCDGKTVFGPWAYMCATCVRIYGADWPKPTTLTRRSAAL